MGLAAALFFLTGASAKAQARLELDPFVGYETSGSYPVSIFTSTGGITIPINRLRVNDSLAFGTFVDYNVTENFQAEFMWNRNNTSYSAHNVLTERYFKAFDSTIDQFQFGGLYMFLGSEHKLRPYAAFSVGFTHDSNGGGTPNRTEFSWSVGGGVKYLIGRHFGLRGDLRYLPTYGSSSSGVYCDPFFGCYSTTLHNYLNRGSFVGGIIVKF
jgi:hypothetical protein